MCIRDRGKPVLCFGARHVHPAVAPVMERAAVVGGADGASCILGAKLAGLEPSGTVPHEMCIRDRAYIDSYFLRYPGVKAFLDGAVEQGKKEGYVKTLFGRRRYLPNLKSRNFALRSFAARTAMNSPIQGSAADIIKLEMCIRDSSRVSLSRSMSWRLLQSWLMAASASHGATPLSLIHI